MPENIDESTEVVPVVDGEVDPGSVPEDDETTPGAEALGDAGKRALDSMKAKWRAERDKRRELEEQLTASSTPAGDAETPDVDAIRRDAVKAANARVLRSEVKAAAAGKFADPSDAFLYLDLSAFEVDENGEIDSEEIADAIQEVLVAKPYLAAATVKRFQGTGDGGAARNASGPAQLTRDDLKGMSPEAISKAKQDGRLANLLTGKA